jgi:pantoate--beta-alanine ligase
VVNGEKALLRCKKAKEFLLQEGFIKVDYIEIRDCTSLSTITNEKTNARIFGAAYLGNTRLLDNVPLLSYVNMDF